MRTYSIELSFETGRNPVFELIFQNQNYFKLKNIYNLIPLNNFTRICYFARPYPKEMTLDILFIYHLKQIRAYILWESTEKGKETELMLGMLNLFSTEFN